MINKRRNFQMKKTFLPISALLLVLALAVTACGGAPTEPPPPPAPAGDPVKGEELFVTVWAKI
jgi:hypothetical protein